MGIPLCQINLIQPDGSGLREIVPRGMWASWSGDGRWLYYVPARPSPLTKSVSSRSSLSEALHVQSFPEMQKRIATVRKPGQDVSHGWSKSKPVA